MNTRASADQRDDLLSSFTPNVRQIALDLRAMILEVVPDAIEEVDPSAKLIAFTFIPGTYRGLFVAIAPQQSYVNLMFSKGVELLPLDPAGLLQGTGKQARHIRFDNRADVANAHVRTLVSAADGRTPRT